MAATLTWETRAENLQAQAENRGSAPSVDNSSSSASTRQRASGALAFAASELAMRELGTGRRLELYADSGLAHAQASFFQSGWRRKQDAWCDERSSTVQAAAGQLHKAWQPSPPLLRIESTLEDASDYSRRCRSGGGTNDDVRNATQRPWSHGATSVGISTPVLLQRQDGGSWQWAGGLPDPANTATFRQDTTYRITVRTK